MNKYKVCVYAISKNEEKYIDKWYDSVKEADEIYVLDTGSSDKTVKKLKKLGVKVKKQKIKPWRFDIARNKALDMVPLDTDICVCIDLDEVFNNGWRKKLEDVWNNNTNRCRYIYNWIVDSNNSPEVSFYYEKIHSRKHYKWIYPVHEILEYDGELENYVVTDNIVLNHYPDSTKSRSNYLPLLELSIIEDPNNDRNMHYLGREYMYYGMWNKSIDTFIEHLNLKSSTEKNERYASMRFISRCYKSLNRYNEVYMWLEKAINEAPYLRDVYIEMAIINYELGDWKNCELYSKEALKIKEHPQSYINETFSFDETAYDLLSLSLYYMGNYKDSLANINKALEINPKNKRIINNKELIESIINKEQN